MTLSGVVGFAVARSPVIVSGQRGELFLLTRSSWVANTIFSTSSSQLANR
jgi:hypothetical protein